MFSEPMMYIQKMRGRFNMRVMLLAWSYLRLAISALWTAIAFIALIVRIKFTYHDDITKDPEFVLRTMLYPIFLIVQLVQCAMLITLIVGGHKKNVTLYRIYYVYAIVDFVIYLFVMVSPFVIDYHPFLEIYITFHAPEMIDIFGLNEKPWNDTRYDTVVGLAFVVDICFEVGLLWVLNKMIRRISQENKNVSEIPPGCSTIKEKECEVV